MCLLLKKKNKIKKLKKWESKTHLLLEKCLIFILGIIWTCIIYIYIYIYIIKVKTESKFKNKYFLIIKWGRLVLATRSLI